MTTATTSPPDSRIRSFPLNPTALPAIYPPLYIRNKLARRRWSRRVYLTHVSRRRQEGLSCLQDFLGQRHFEKASASGHGYGKKCTSLLEEQTILSRYRGGRRTRIDPERRRRRRSIRGIEARIGLDISHLNSGDWRRRLWSSKAELPSRRCSVADSQEIGVGRIIGGVDGCEALVLSATNVDNWWRGNCGSKCDSDMKQESNEG